MGCIIKFKGQSIPEEQFLQYLNKQIAINNLFEEDKTFANSVYEALGFKTNADVILPIGTSGSGKSTFIKSLPQENLVVIEPDAMRVEFTGDMNDKSKDKEIYEEATKRAITAIKQGKQVVFDTTNLTKEKRRPFIEGIREEIPNANIQYKLMELNPELAKQRIKAQLERGENRAAVSDETIDRHATSYKQMLEDIKSEPISNYEITPQQKQQALQVYSQYLDTNPNTEKGSKQNIQGFKEFVNKVKPGVAELFESNPELAEAIYSAMGLNTINESEITYTDEEGNPCAKMGLTNTVKGTNWKIVKDFKGKPKHSQGGVDITISNDGVSMRRDGKDIKAKYGLLITNNI